MTAMTPWQRFLRLLDLDRRVIGHIYLYALVGGGISLSVPLGVQAIINLISGGQIATSWGVLVAFVTIGVGVGGGLQVMQLALTENLQQRLFARSALEFAFRMPRISTAAVQGKHLAELANRFFDTLTVQKGLAKLLLDLPLAFLQVVLGLVLLALYHPFFIAFGVLLIMVLYLILRFSGRRGLETSLEESKYKYAVAHWLEELGRAHETFKRAGRTDLPLDRTDRLVNGYVLARKAHFKVILWQSTALVVFKVLVTLGLLAIGGTLVMTERMNIGQFVAAEIVILLVIGAVEKMVLCIEHVYDVLTALEKLGSVTDLPLERTDGMQMLRPPGEPGGMSVALRGVGLRSYWNQAPVLAGIDLELAPGEKVCIQGGNGSGKTSLLRIIGGTLEPTEGSLLLDGHPVTAIDLDLVRSVIGDSMEQEEIFSGTVLENVTMGRAWVTEDDVVEACQATGLFDQMTALPKGLLTELDPQGTRLPRNVVKRIIQARSIAGKPRLMLLEDSFLDLDRPDREQVLSYITAPERPWTLIAVSNDRWLQQRCQRTFVLHQGRLQPI